MKTSRTLHQYQQIYIDLNFERAALFEALQRHHRCTTVLYPGSSVHITPSLTFPHVVYVDSSDSARQFFAASDAIQDFVTRHKRYKRSPYIRFISQSYLEPLPLADHSFDLLISLYAGGIAHACGRYLRPGGLLLTNNHHDDGRDAASDPAYRLIAVASVRKESVHFAESDLDEYFIPKKSVGVRTYIQQASRWPEYTRSAEYYLFRRVAW